MAGLLDNAELGLAGAYDWLGEHLGFDGDSHVAADIVAAQTADDYLTAHPDASALDAAALAMDLDAQARAKDEGHAVIDAAAAQTADQVGSGLLTTLKVAAWVGGAIAVIYLVDLGVRVAKVIR